MMKRVYVCAELGEKENLEQMKEYSRYVLMRGATPVVSHFYALCLDDSDPKEREIKQAAGLNLLWICDEAWVFGSTIAGGFAPTSETADIISKALGTRTVMTGSVSRSKNDPSQSLQMTERPLMTADELRSIRKGNFIVMKTGTHPFVSKLKLFFQWGISFSDEKYNIADKGARKVSYVSKDSLKAELQKRYPCNQDLNTKIGASTNIQEQYHDCKATQSKPIRTE